MDSLPFSLILINTLQVYRDDLPILNAQLGKLLREQDLIPNKNDEQMLLILPYTKDKVTLKVIE